MYWLFWSLFFLFFSRLIVSFFFFFFRFLLAHWAVIIITAREEHKSPGAGMSLTDMNQRPSRNRISCNSFPARPIIVNNVALTHQRVSRVANYLINSMNLMNLIVKPIEMTHNWIEKTLWSNQLCQLLTWSVNQFKSK